MKENNDLREEFRKYCTTDNFSAPPYETDTIADWFLSRTIPKEEVVRVVGEIENTDLSEMTYGAFRRMVIQKLSELGLMEK